MELKKAWILYRRQFMALSTNRAIIGFMIYAIVLTFITTWNDDQKMVNLASFVIGELGEEKQYAFQDAFYDYYFVAYIPLILFFIRPFVMNEVIESHTVSNALWLRMAPTTQITLVLYRIMIIAGAGLLLLTISILWAALFSIYHNINFTLLIQSFYSLFGYVILAGGLIIFIKGKPNQKIELRHAYVWLILILPIVLFFFRDTGFKKFGYIYPAAGPYLKHNIGVASWSSTNAAVILGSFLLTLALLITCLKSYKSRS